MIATLSGFISEKLIDIIVLDVAGVGYGLFVTVEDHGIMTIDEPIKLYIYEHIREQQHDLFGFLSLESKSFFELLLSVNGVGPKMALNLLSVGSAGLLKQAIASGDVKFISQANGVGKRLAERIVVELKNKVGLASVDLETTGLLHSDDSLMKDEAVEALVALGYTPQDAIKSLEGIDTNLSTKERLTQALRGKK